MDVAKFSRPIILWGPPGAGKSTVGRALAGALGAAYFDSDDELTREHNATVSELFAREHEWGFRAVEALTVRRLVSAARAEGTVLSLGGGALLNASLRHELLERAWVVVLAAPVATLHERVSRVPDSRPLLQNANSSRLEALIEARREAYAECHCTVDASVAVHTVLDQVIAAVQALEASQPVCIPLGERTYGVRFLAANSVIDQLSMLRPRPSKVLLVTDQNALAAPGIRALIDSLKPASTVVLDGGGDQDKSLENLALCWGAALDAGFDRHSFVLAIGGGVVSDLAGFAASTLLRGVRYGTVATTVLAMADASVGGKTAIDFGPGKNLVGAFHQPSFVCCAAETLSSLSVRDRRAGLAEVVKIALVADRQLFDLVSENADSLREGDPDAIGKVLRPAVQAKARVVLADERENGRRICLNFGHTLGHALEQHWTYQISHGECVALGMCAALEIGERFGHTSHTDVTAPTRAILQRLGLPTALPMPVDLEKVAVILARDKKRSSRDGDILLQFITVNAIGAFETRALTIPQVLEGLSVFR